MKNSTRSKARKDLSSLSRFQPRLEILEDRTLPAIFMVDNLNDEGAGSLRQAIEDANTTANAGGPDDIVFNVNGTILVGSTSGNPLPTIMEAVNIDGTSAPGYGGTPVIELDGTNAGAGANGLRITNSGSTIRALAINRFGDDGIEISGVNASGNVVGGNFIGTDITGTMALGNGFDGVFIVGGATNNTIGGTTMGARNLISGNFEDGVHIQGTGTSGNVVAGNFIGTDVEGTMALANDDNGVLIVDGATNNTIGGTAMGARNLISGNADDGVDIADMGTSGNVVQGNFIGTDLTGTVALANSDDGVDIDGGATNTTIGGTAMGARNLISGNGENGVDIDEVDTTGHVVQGNYIGTDVTGTVALPNGDDGVDIDGGAANNIIGGTGMGAGNLISGNADDGVDIDQTGTSGNVVSGNRIGTDVTGTLALPNTEHGVEVTGGATANTVGGTATGAGNTIAFNGVKGIILLDAGTVGNSILGNSIFSNTNLGIDLGNDGVTTNDNMDPDPGPNRLQNYPLITRAESGPPGTLIEGTLNSTPGRTFRLEFFSSIAADPSGFGEGQTFLSSLGLTTDGTTGDVSFSTTLALAVPAGMVITATATDMTTGDTSEFSGVQMVVSESPTVTINQAVGQPDPTNMQPFLFTAVFSEPVTGFEGADISFVGSTVGGNLMASVTQSGRMDGTTYTVSVTGATTSGNVVASVPAGVAQDAAGNLNTASTSMDNTVLFDVTAPTVTINQAVGQPAATNQQPIFFTAIFSKPVTGFDGSDISFAGSTVPGPLTALVTESGPMDGTTFTVRVNVLVGMGNVVASVIASAAQDAVGNPSTASTSVDNTVFFDNLAPTVTIDQSASQPDPTTQQPLLFTAVFSEPVTGFDGGDISFVGSTAGGALMASVTQSGPMDGATFTVSITGAITAGDVVVSIPAGAGQDALNNPSQASTSTDNQVQFLANTVLGTVYVDINGNGVQDPGEPGLPNAPVFADINGNGIQDANEPGTVTDDLGRYGLGRLPVGTQAIVNPLPPASFVRINPLGNTILLDQAIPIQVDQDFGIHPISPAAFTFPTLRPTVVNPAANPNVLYVQSLFRQILGREADAVGLTVWVSLLPLPGTTTPFVYQQARQFVAQGIWNSFEHRGLQVNTFYQNLLGRLPDAIGGSLWFSSLFFGISTELEVVAAIVASPEYQGQFASQQDFLNGLYADVLGSLTGPIPVSFNAGPQDVLGDFLAGRSSASVLAINLVFSDQSLIRGLNGLGLSYFNRFLDPVQDNLGILFGLYRSSSTPLTPATNLLAGDEYLMQVLQGLV